jgi:TPR repeat protein
VEGGGGGDDDEDAVRCCPFCQVYCPTRAEELKLLRTHGRNGLPDALYALGMYYREG